MPENVLEKIIHKKKIKISELKKNLELSYLQDLIDKNNTLLILKKKLKLITMMKNFQLLLKLKKQVHQLE